MNEAMMRQTRLMVVVAVSILWLTPATSSADPNYVYVSAPRTGGGPNILCQGEACASVIASLLGGMGEHETETPPLGGDESVAIDDFCSKMQEEKPGGCGSSAPAVPHIGSSWQPNGCGTGPLANFFLDAALSLGFSDHYSDDLNAPYPNVDFTGACNGHDTCWAEGGQRGICDIAFRNAMQAACGTDSTCQGFASLYHGVVATTNASNSAYANSNSRWHCAVWHQDMSNNGCET